MQAKTLSQIVKADIQTPISDNDIRNICNGRVEVMSYKMLSDAASHDQNLMQMFTPEKNNCICLLYQWPGQQVGHWVAIIFDENTDEINFFNSYGYPPDRETNQQLLTKMLAATGKKININTVRYQTLSDNVSTCGLHAAIRCVFNEYSNKEYHKMLSSISVSLISDNKNSRYDKLVSLMSVLPLKFNIPQD